MNTATRPLYETQADLDNEKKLLKLAYPDRDAIKLPRSYHADFWLPHKALPPVVVECKQRSAAFREYDTYMISLAKFTNCRRLADAMGGFFDIVVGWGDGVVTVAQIRGPSKPFPFAIRPGGRADRNDPADFEPMVHINIGSFKEITPK